MYQKYYTERQWGRVTDTRSAVRPSPPSTRVYIGEYSYAGNVIDGGMPQLVDAATFEEVQKRFAVNKRRGAKTKAELSALGDDAPDYWLTGRLFCERCGGP
ncbi:MAG: hypothetical protein ACK5MR_17695, partial [Cumulibacter sp.]